MKILQDAAPSTGNREPLSLWTMLQATVDDINPALP